MTDGLSGKLFLMRALCKSGSARYMKKVFALGMAAVLLAFVLAGCGNEDCPGGDSCMVVLDGIGDGGDDDANGDAIGQSCGAFFCATHNPQDIGVGEVIFCDCGWLNLPDLPGEVSAGLQRGCCRL